MGWGPTKKKSRIYSLEMMSNGLSQVNGDPQIERLRLQIKF